MENTSGTDKAIVVFSGGMDSTTALAMAVRKLGAENVVALNFAYGSKHNQEERQAAFAIVRKLVVDIACIDLDFVDRLFESDLLISGGEIPEGHYEAESMKATVVPFRNGIMLSIAAGYAESVGANMVVLGSHAGDHAIYPDCRPMFNNSMGCAMHFGTDEKVTLEVPFTSLSKADIVREAITYKAPLSMTYSCYKGQEGVHCGVCGTCTERIQAFLMAGYRDTVKYDIDFDWLKLPVYPY